MAAKRSQTGRTFARHVAPFAPLALALAMNAVPSSTPATGSELSEQDIPDNITAVKCEENIADFQECHANYPTGCSKAAGYDAYLNYLKNLTPTAPTGGVNFLNQSSFDNLNAKTPSDLGQSNNHATYKEQLAQMGEGQQVGLVGYLYYYQATGAESSNCELTGPDSEGGNVDFHIGIGFKPQPQGATKHDLQDSSVIVEMTPHYRAQFHEGVWTLANLKQAQGHKVRIMGQLLVDSEHNKPMDNCALQGTAAQKNRCWRYSIWELHPVTVFEYCEDDSCTEASGSWIPIGTNSSANTRGGSSEGSSDGASATGAGRRSRDSTRSAEPRSGSTAQP
jgi:hypothetical protein